MKSYPTNAPKPLSLVSYPVGTRFTCANGCIVESTRVNSNHNEITGTVVDLPQYLAGVVPPSQRSQALWGSNGDKLYQNDWPPRMNIVGLA